MKKEYNYPRHGNSPGESTKQHVHADTEPNGHNNLFSQTKNTSMSHTTQNRTMKTKTNINFFIKYTLPINNPLILLYFLCGPRSLFSIKSFYRNSQ